MCNMYGVRVPEGVYLVSHLSKECDGPVTVKVSRAF